MILGSYSPRIFCTALPLMHRGQRLLFFVNISSFTRGLDSIGLTITRIGLSLILSFNVLEGKLSGARNSLQRILKYLYLRFILFHNS
jgi:hypothetical protein